MREILFRGKWIANGKWLEGGFHYRFGKAFIIGVSKRLNIGGMEVIPETVGQYTGLTDKNGKRIFEGDIVRCIDKSNDYEFTALVMFGNPNGTYNWGYQLKQISGVKANTDILLWVEVEETGAYIEIIGNIHDNPELLEGEQR